jgi:hypothetical protein
MRRRSTMLTSAIEGLPTMTLDAEPDRVTAVASSMRAMIPAEAGAASASVPTRASSGRSLGAAGMGVGLLNMRRKTGSDWSTKP